MKLLLAIISIYITEIQFCNAQNIVKNGSFELIDSCYVNSNGVAANRPNDWFSLYDNTALFTVHSTNPLIPCTPMAPFKPIDGQNVLQLGFRVNTVRVTNSYIQSELGASLQKDSVYTIRISVRKNLFSAGNIKELHILFSSSKIPFTSTLNLRSVDENIIKLNMNPVSASKWHTFEVTYRALGTEHYISIGSFQQKFNLREGMSNYTAERMLATSNLPNAIYFVDDLAIEKSYLTVANPLELSEAPNIQNLYFSSKNLIYNGGFEYSPNTLDRLWLFNIPGVAIAPGWLNLTSISASVFRVDSNSNFYRYKKINGSAPYMGNGVALVDLLKTNHYHTYQKHTEIYRGETHTEVYYYENEPPTTPIAPYKGGAYLSGVLKEPLKKDSTYLFSVMAKLSSESSFGVSHMGLYFHDQFPKDVDDSLYRGVPDLVFNVENLANTQDWVALSGYYTANGNERFFSVGYFDNPATGIVKNSFFERVVFQTCGPNYKDGYCFNYEVTFKDSLFSRYFFDNFVLRSINDASSRGASIFDPAVVNQTQWIFDFGGSKKNTEAIESAKALLIKTLDVMRIDDGIAISYLNKANDVKLAPTNYENKRKIIRLVNQFKLTIKPGLTTLYDYGILFDAITPVGYKNTVVLVTESHLNIAPAINKIKTFCEMGGTFIILNLGNDDAKQKLNIGSEWSNNIVFFDINEPMLFEKMLLLIWN